MARSLSYTVLLQSLKYTLSYAHHDHRTLTALLTRTQYICSMHTYRSLQLTHSNSIHHSPVTATHTLTAHSPHSHRILTANSMHHSPVTATCTLTAHSPSIRSAGGWGSPSSGAPMMQRSEESRIGHLPLVSGRCTHDSRRERR